MTRPTAAKLTMQQTSKIHTEFLYACERVAGKRVTAILLTPEYRAACKAFTDLVLPLVREQRLARPALRGTAAEKGVK